MSLLLAIYHDAKFSKSTSDLGILMGAFVCSMVFVSSWEYAALLLLFIGIFSGMLIVPLNAFLQHRGHILIGSGHSIAAQNFSENLGILILSGSLYAYGEIRPTYNWNCIYIFGLFVLMAMVIASIYYSQDNK
jgi:LPLT family lysophospholipid transporter-like MFS transporter